MVIYRTADGQPGYHQAEELDEAVRFVERLRNGDGVDGARIFKMEEVNFDFRPYFKVEIGPGGVPIDTPAAPAFAGRDPGFSTDLGFGAEAPVATPPSGYDPPTPFAADAWADTEMPAPEAPVESAADLGLESEPVPSFVAPPSATDSVIDALPTPTPLDTFEPPAAEGDELDSNGVGARRGLFGR